MQALLKRQGPPGVVSWTAALFRRPLHVVAYQSLNEAGRRRLRYAVVPIDNVRRGADDPDGLCSCMLMR